MIKCFAYLRVSSVGQIDGDGWTRQLLACVGGRTGIYRLDVS